jgi:hypothetical protein
MRLFQQSAKAYDDLISLAVQRGLGRYLHQFDDVAVRVRNKSYALLCAPGERTAIRFYVHRGEVVER